MTIGRRFARSDRYELTVAWISSRRGAAARGGPRPLLGEPEHVAVGHHEGALRRDAEVDGQARVAHEHAVLAVDRDEVHRPEDVQEQLQLLLAGVAGHVGPRVRLAEVLPGQLAEGV